MILFTLSCRARDPEIPTPEAEQVPDTTSPNRLARFIRSMMHLCGIFVSIAEGIDRRAADCAWTHQTPILEITAVIVDDDAPPGGILYILGNCIRV